MLIDDTLPLPKPRILVVLEPYAESSRLLRTARLKAEREGIDWEVLIVERPRVYSRHSAADKETLLGLVTLAEQMGAHITKWRAKSTLAGILEVVAERKAEGIPIKSIKVGEAEKNPWYFFQPPLAERLKQAVGKQIRVTALPLGREASLHSQFAQFFHFKRSGLFASLLAVALATFLIEAINHFMPEMFGPYNRNRMLIYLIACMYVAARHGFLAGLIASTSSFLLLSFFYLSPNHSLLINEPENVMSLALFTLAGIVISIIGNNDFDGRLLLTKRANRFHSLLKVHRLALNKNTVEETIATLDDELKALLGTDVVFLVPAALDHSVLETFYRKDESYFRKDLALNNAEQSALALCWEESRITGVGAAFCPEGCEWRFEPLLTAQGEIGVLGVRITPKIEIDVDFGQLMSGIADQVALILERLQLEKTMESSKIQAEREKLRTMLLSSVSHDLKTPLASVIGSLSVFRSMGEKLPQEHRVALINTALGEAQRLDSFITNILDMTRLESGQVELKSEWVRPDQVVEDVCKRLRERMLHHELVLHPYQEKREVAMDVMMTGQVVQNLLDNAIKYTPAGTRVEVSMKADAEGFALSVRDHGKGIPDDQLEKVFDKYTRINKQDTQAAGTGLGLAIARAVMHAQQGTITAANHGQGGAVFTLTLPKTRQPQPPQAA